MELFTMWKNTRMVVLVAVSAALYVAVLLPFKVLVIIPGITEIRPAGAIPTLCSFLFGPAAAWGAAIGNLIGDIFGNTLTPSSSFGFIGNFLYGYIPYTLWRALTRDDPDFRSVAKTMRYIGITFLSSLVCTVTIAIGVGIFFGLKPLPLLILSIMFNNFVMSCTLGVILLAALYPTIKAMCLTYQQVMSEPKHVEHDLDSLVP